jgi:hypothetical protein
MPHLRRRQGHGMEDQRSWAMGKQASLRPAIGYVMAMSVTGAVLLMSVIIMMVLGQNGTPLPTDEAEMIFQSEPTKSPSLTAKGACGERRATHPSGIY